MLIATVVGPIWASKRLDPFPPAALLEVECASGEHLVAIDPLGSGPGDRVLVTTGSAVMQSFPGKAPMDAVIVGVIDEPVPAPAIPPKPPINSKKPKEGTDDE